MSDAVRLFNKKTIVIFSVLMTPLFGALLYAQNLSILGMQRKIVWPILFTIMLFPLTINIQKKTQLEILYILPIIQLVGGLVIAFGFWDAQIGSGLKYHSKKPWGPLLVFLLVWGSYFVMALYMYYYKS